MVNPVAMLGALPSIGGFAPLPFAAANSFMAMQGGNMAVKFGGYYKLSGRIVDEMTPKEIKHARDNPKWFYDNYLKPQSDFIVTEFKKEIEQHSQIIQEMILQQSHQLELKKVEYNIRLLKELPKEYIEQFTGMKLGGAPQDININLTQGGSPTLNLSDQEKSKASEIQKSNVAKKEYVENVKTSPLLQETPKHAFKEKSEKVKITYKYFWSNPYDGGKTRKLMTVTTKSLDYEEHQVDIKKMRSRASSMAAAARDSERKYIEYKNMLDQAQSYTQAVNSTYNV
jgi:hypothetical protein